MPENPLLPNAKLRELYALMQQARASSTGRSGAPRLEAILAATLMHLEPGDFISPPQGSPDAERMIAERLQGKKRAASQAAYPPLPKSNRLTFATGIAQGLKMARDSRIAAFYADAGQASVRSEAGWTDALAYASQAELPLLLIVSDVRTVTRVTNPKALTWDSVSKVAKPLRLPVLSVDGADAVAVYRVMQESVLRARTIGGAAVIWCSLSRPGGSSPALDPLEHMKQYLAVRNLLPRTSAAKKRNRPA